MFQASVLSAAYKVVLDLKNEGSEKGIFEKAHIYNPWFTENNIQFCLQQWVEALNPENRAKFIDKYNWSDCKKNDKKLGLILAGNIPLVGLHDCLCGLLCGFTICIKTSSDDDYLIQLFFKQFKENLPELSNQILFVEKLNNCDVVIATGSNNSARYFEYYFKEKPLLLRKNRNSVAVLSGNETQKELEELGMDVFTYFGLGCRNVTHLYLPKGYYFKPLFDAWEKYYEVIHHNKYANNYTYHKSLLLMNLDPHLDSGYVILKESAQVYAPVGMLHFSFYENLAEIKDQFKSESENIQCTVSNLKIENAIPFGEAQKTRLWHYADGVDTVNWLIQNK